VNKTYLLIGAAVLAYFIFAKPKVKVEIGKASGTPSQGVTAQIIDSATGAVGAAAGSLVDLMRGETGGVIGGEDS